MKPIVIIDSLVQDVHAHAVKWALNRKGYECYIIFGENIPVASKLNLEIDEYGGYVVEYLDRHNGFKIKSSDKVHYWARRCASPSNHPELNIDDHEIAFRENKAALDSVREILSRSDFSVNSISDKRMSDVKAIQLIAASKCGFSIPKTLQSNNSKRIIEFVQSNEVDTIVKTFTPLVWCHEKEAGRVYRTAYGFKVSGDSTLDEVQLGMASSIYQEYINKKYEVRVFIFGDNCFGTKLDSQKNKSTRIDWRADQDELSTCPMNIPDEIKERCRLYLSKMNLKMGCFDFIVTNEDEWVFLECNEQGQWLWQEEYSPEELMLDAFSNFLINPDVTTFCQHNSTKLSFLDYRDNIWPEESERVSKENVLLEASHVSFEKEASM